MDKLAELGLSLEQLRESDLDELKKEKVISLVESLQIKQELIKMKKEQAGAEEARQQTEKRLPLPNQPPMEPLRPSTLSTFQGVSVQVPAPPGGGLAQPPNLMELTAAHWMTIFIQCNLGRGVKLLDPITGVGKRYLLIPPNTNLLSLFTASQESERYHREITAHAGFEKTLVMGEHSAYAKVSSPFVSGSASLKAGSEDAMVHEGETYMQIVKYKSPVGTFDLSTSRIVIDKPREQYDVPLDVNPEFVSDVRDMLERAEKEQGARKWEVVKPLLEHITTQFGEILGTSVTVGVALYTREMREQEKTQSKHDASFSFQGAVSASASGGSGEAGYGTQSKKSNEAGQSSGASSFEWIAIAGNTGNDPASLTKYRHQPTAWRSIHVDEYISVFDLLPREMRDKMKELEKYVPADALYKPAERGPSRRELQKRAQQAEDELRKQALQREEQKFHTTYNHNGDHYKTNAVMKVNSDCLMKPNSWDKGEIYKLEEGAAVYVNGDLRMGPSGELYKLYRVPMYVNGNIYVNGDFYECHNVHLKRGCQVHATGSTTNCNVNDDIDMSRVEFSKKYFS